MSTRRTLVTVDMRSSMQKSELDAKHPILIKLKIMEGPMGECRHLKRYDRYPAINFYFDKAGLTNDEVKVILTVS